MKTGEKIQVVVIIFFCVVLDIVLHMVTSPYSTMPDNPNLSFVANILGIEITASLWALSAFSVVAFVFWRIRDAIPKEGVSKGLRYGTAIALLWFLAMLEGVSLFGNPLIKEIIVGLSDAIPVFLMGVLLGLVKPEKGSGTTSVELSPKQKTKTIVLFTVIFLVGRYIAYSLGVIKSGSKTMPIQTFAWTLLMGIAIGTAFMLLGTKRKGKSVQHRAWEFGFLTFGLNWAVFLVFMPLVFSGYIVDVLLRMVIDSTLVTVASYLTIIAREDLLKVGPGTYKNATEQR
ncbi:MAG: hypothetical protein JEY71_15165 [Sphaerochaeta sp.]|nr:hypothetical protein [Sphaerochaeta sp.]